MGWPCEAYEGGSNKTEMVGLPADSDKKARGEGASKTKTGRLGRKQSIDVECTFQVGTRNCTWGQMVEVLESHLWRSWLHKLHRRGKGAKSSRLRSWSPLPNIK